MPVHKINGMVIITTHVRPPIPVRNFDWSAVTDDYEEQGPIGYGKTEQAAIANLLAEIKETSH